ncbi:hypothetical protein [Amycolatopsis circi]|uniref:hypothetical protein n=1 Tax=Amycolatopsis circi TaxID=871959 RepID=UPI000E265113|nr:hypothetical protein [Amycolatopsis circi]
MSVRDQERGATGVGRFLLRALVIAGGAVAATAAAWAVTSGTAGADTLAPHGVLGSDADGSLADAVRPAAESALPANGADRIDGVVHDVTQPVRHLLATAGHARLPRASRDPLGQVLASGGVLPETGKHLLGKGAASVSGHPATESSSAPAGPLSGDKSVVRKDVVTTTVTAFDDRSGAVRIAEAPERSPRAAVSAAPRRAWPTRGIERGSGGRKLPPSLPASVLGPAAILFSAHGGNDGWGAILPGCTMRHRRIGETRCPASHRAVADTACQPGVTPD